MFAMQTCRSVVRMKQLACAVTMLLAACTTGPESRPPLATTPPSEAGSAVTRRPIETPPTPAPAAPAVALAPPRLTVLVPSNALYVCVIEAQGQNRQTAIEFVPKVEKLCRRHPEMGPCQYERNNCRASGGRVFAANNVEITMATEAEYDRKVMRTRFRAN
jgi:hypothetical protein